MALFQSSVLKKYLAAQEHAPMHAAFGAYLTYFHDPMRRLNIRASKEEQFQEGFLRELFVNILGYTINPDPDYNLTTELKNIKDSKKTDGAILKDGKALAVIELKGTDTKDLEKIRDQAFNYKNNQPDCVYVITSNFEKLRFYIHNAVDYVEFSILHMQQDEFRLMWLLLQKDNLLKGIPAQIKAESLLVEEQVTKKLYSDYSSFKQQLWQDMVAKNSGQDELLLYKKSQKLLDRFLFIFFAEDKGLLPPNSISEIIKQWETLEQLDSYVPLYDRFKLYFGFMNTGRPARKDKAEIHAYNGGLFATDPLLDSLMISDALLKTHVSKLTEYDFESEVDTNILGHIFEHSLNDIENVRASLEGTLVDKSKTKRKKDGVFYTPKYITKYIVDNTVGKLCTEKKAELGIVDEEFAKGKAGRKKETLQKLVARLKEYREWLLQLAICDPACGSGAFLNQVLEFLMAEHRYLDELESMLFGSSIVFPNVENHILENNIFGVDINEESVEIARLSLWLRTAQKGRKLSTLSSNIKVGNSLIDDPEVAGDLAFNWQTQFPKVFAKGGFDVVVGNPPYGIFIDKKSQAHFNQNFPLTQYKTNLYVLFIERMLQIFSKSIVHFIIPKSLLFNTYYEAIRRELILKTEINEISTITEEVFDDADVGSSLLLQFTIKKEPNIDNIVELSLAEKVENFVTQFGLILNRVPQSHFLKIPNCEISIISSESQSISNKLFGLKKIKDFYDLKNGLNPGNIKHILISDRKIDENHKPIIWGKDIGKYLINWSGDYVNYKISISEDISLDDVKTKAGMNKQTRIDFALRSPELFESEKIVVRKTGDSLIACLDKGNYYFDTLVHGIYVKNKNVSLEALLTLINSKSATNLYRILHDIKGKVFAKISLDNLGSFPLPEIFKEYNTELKEYSIKRQEVGNLVHAEKDSFFKLVVNKFGLENPSTKLQNWLSLDFKGFLGELTKAKVKLSLSEEAEWMAYFNEQKTKALSLQSDITLLDREIDALVYELYGLTEEEIRIVEGGEG
jgi:type I restriction-modification system DNA methylase subunit